MDPPYSIWSVHHDVLLSHMAPPIWPDGRKPLALRLAHTRAQACMDGMGAFTRLRGVPVACVPFPWVVLFLFHSMTTRAATAICDRFPKPLAANALDQGPRPRVRVSTWVRACKDRRCCTPRAVLYL